MLFSDRGKLLLDEDGGYNGGEARNGLAYVPWWSEWMVSWLLAKVAKRSKNNNSTMGEYGLSRRCCAERWAARAGWSKVVVG